MPAKPSAPRSAPTGPVTLVLKVTLLNVEPACWRRLVVDPQMTLNRLHEVLQTVFDWHNGHLHEFWTALRGGGDGRRFGPPDPDGFRDPYDDIEDSTRVRLASLVARRGARLFYIYDFGDTWEHEIRCEKVIREGFDTLPVPPEFLRAAAKSKRPKRIWAFCHDGAGRTPPEDCGGPWGYAEMLAELADPTHDEHLGRREWLGLDEGEAWDPNAFDLDAVNGWLSKMR